ncbi:MAG: hypothetical protein NTW86_02565, partial [Candidatus Sumerlaeota bacterium]|nr:hypothetical protein [Candidatus Sumerlaeota bacterium]
AMLQAKYPSLPIVADGTPVGRVDSRPGDVVLASFHEWNQRLAKLPGISGFSQYGWTEFEEGQGSPSGLSQDRATDPVDLARRLTQYYDPFVSNLPSRQIAVYQADWGPEMKMHMTQWGTHHDGNTVLQGLHVANFYFFLAEYNAAHDDYFQTAISAFILADKAANPRDRDPMFGGGLLYKKNILLRSPYLYTKPFRYLFSGDKALLETSINGAVQDGSFATLKALAARGPDRKKYIYILNRGPATSCGTISIDGEEMPAETRGQVECVWGESLAAVPGKEGFETYSGERSLAGLAIPPYSLTVIIVP